MAAGEEVAQCVRPGGDDLRRVSPLCLLIESLEPLSNQAFRSALGSSIAAPGVEDAMDDFGSDSSILSALIVSVYNLGLAVGPVIMAPLSEMYGRLMPYNITNVLLTVFTVASALSPNLSSLIVFRMLCGMEASAVMNIGGATVADLFVQEERGLAMAVWTFGPLLGPAVGPIMGGYITEALGWRWVFWVVAITVSIASNAYLNLRHLHV